MRSIFRPRRRAGQRADARLPRACRRLAFEPLENRRLLADLRLTAVQLIEPDRVTTPVTPIIGQEICVKASFVTTSLPAGASYRIEYVVDGAAQYQTLTSGAGVGSGSYYGFRCGWYATPGSHRVERVTIDIDNSVTETDEGNNLLTPNIVFTPVPPPDLAQKFANPMGGALGRDWYISNYHDVDRASGPFEDFRGGPYAYDGHEAYDIGLPGFARMDAGIPVHAAAAGTVVSTADGNFDRNTARGSRPANFVTLDHGNGWQSIYYHFAANTITVQPGQTVLAGQMLGLTGSSGDSSGPHLHFGIRHYGGAIEPGYQPELFFQEPQPYQGDQPTALLDMGITNYAPSDADFDERPVEATRFSTPAGGTVYVWFRYSTFKADEEIQLKWYRPSGQLTTTSTITTTTDRRGGWYWRSRSLTNFASAPGVWRVAIEKNGVELGSRTFEVTTGTAPGQMRFSGAGDAIIVDNRTTAIDFGTHGMGAAAPTQTFTIRNLGPGNLLLGDPIVPPGFEVVLDYPRDLGPTGSWTTFEVRMATSEPGYKFGAVHFPTNDPDTPIFNFNVSGTVTGPAPAGAPVLTLGGPAATSVAFGPPVLLKPVATVSDTDTANFAGGRLRVEFAAPGAADDELMIVTSGPGSGQIGLGGAEVTWNGQGIGTYFGGREGQPLVIDFAGTTPAEAVAALVRAVGFRTTSLRPDTLARYVRFTLADGEGKTSNRPIAVVVQDLKPTTLRIIDGDLLIADTAAAGKSDRWRLEREGTQFKLTDLSGNAIDASSIASATGSGTAVVRFPFGLLAEDGQVLVDSRYGVDQVTVVPTFGSPVPSGGVGLLSGNAAIAANPVNQAPTLDLTTEITVLEDAGMSAMALAGISPGEGDFQALQFHVTSDAPELLPAPQVSYVTAASTGELTFATVPNRSGQAVVTLKLQDNGGTLSGGIDQITRTVTVTVLPVNDAPEFSVPERYDTTDASGPQAVGNWASGISPGAADEAGQHLTFAVVSNSEPGLFLVPPQLDAAGKLSFTPRPNAEGTASIGVVLKDDGGSEHGGNDTSGVRLFEIHVTKPFPWHNTRHALDVTGFDGVVDQMVTAIDALAVVNYINAFGTTSVPIGSPVGPPYLDTTGSASSTPDNMVTAADALAVINFINAFGTGLSGPAGEPEGLSLSAPVAGTNDLLEALLALDVATQPRRKRT